MILKSIMRNVLTPLLLVYSFSVYAAENQIKCPPVQFIKNVSGLLNVVTRTEPNTFDVSFWDKIYELQSNRMWYISVNTTTKQDYDYNTAFKIAKENIAVPLHSFNVTTSERLGICVYDDTNNNHVVELYMDNDHASSNARMKVQRKIKTITNPDDIQNA